MAASAGGCSCCWALRKGDGEREVDFLAEKVAHLRIFIADGAGKMNLSVKDIAGAVLSISQFTLASDIGKGRRPDFANAAEPARAEALYGRFNEQLAAEVRWKKGCSAPAWRCTSSMTDR